MMELSIYQKELNAFRARSETNYIFACQASIPLVLTPDLLYQLWNNFKQYQYSFDAGITYKISHIAVSDLLMSNLCREVGYELYEIEKNTRDILLTDLVLSLGAKRRNTIAAFLKDYAQLEYRFGHRKNIRDIHELTAAAILDPSEMERQIIERINSTEKESEKINYLMLHHNLLPADFQSDLRNLSAKAGSNSLSPILVSENDPNAPGVLNVKLPASLRKKVIERKFPSEYIEEVSPVDVVGIVNDCFLQNEIILDLGNWGLTDDDFNEGSPLDEALRRCTQLQTLTLNNEPGSDKNKGIKNRLTKIPSCINSLSSLSVFFCNGDEVDPWGITEMAFTVTLPELTNIDLSYNEITVIKNLSFLPSLQRLELNNNKITETTGLSGIISLNLLSLENNLITRISGLNQCEHLQQLFLAGNKISKIGGLEQLASLNQLDLDNNQIRKIEGLDHLTDLEKLSLNGNSITELGGLEQLQSLEYLEIANNKISAIKDMANLSGLRSLIIRNNELSEINPLKGLSALEYLDAGYNKLMRMEGAGNLSSLQHLLLNNNFITAIENLEHLPVLETLDLGHNHIASLEGILDFLKNTNKPVHIVNAFSHPPAAYLEIKLDDNPLIDPPIEIAMRGREPILEYFNKPAANQKQETENKKPGSQDWLRMYVTETAREDGVTANLTMHVTGGEYDLLGTLPIQKKMISDLLSRTEWTADLGRTLFELMVPLNISEEIQKFNNIIWVVDNITAAYPWEKLQEPGDGLAPLALRKGMIRQFAGTGLPRSSKPAKGSAYIVGDPDMKGYIGQIPGAEEEARLINELMAEQGFETLLSLREEASKIIERLFSNEYSIVHFATHAYYNANVSAQSGLVIGKDVYLTSLEFSRMHTLPEFIFINANHMGKTDLADRLLKLGVKTMIVCGDMVDDRLAVEFSVAFYKSMFAGNNFGTATLQARLSVSTKFPNIGAWGVYQCCGDPYYTFSKTGADKSQQSAADKAHLVEQRKMPVAKLQLKQLNAVTTGFLLEGSAVHESMQDELVIMTTHHALNGKNGKLLDPSEIIVSFEAIDQGEQKFKLSTIEWFSPMIDAAVLRFDKTELARLHHFISDISFYSIAKHVPPTDKKISAIGYFQAGALKVSEQESEYIDIKEPSSFTYTRPINYGISGCPLFNSDWELIGMHRAMVSMGPSGTEANEGIWLGAIIDNLRTELNSKPRLKKLRMFLSSSSSLKEAGESLSRMIAQKNKELEQKNYTIELIRWEDLNFETTLSAHLREVLTNCDVFLLVLDTPMPDYVRDEFFIAYDQFKSTGKPLIYTFVRSYARSSKSVIALQARQFADEILKLGFVVNYFDNPSDLIPALNQQLDKLIDLEPLKKNAMNDKMESLTREYDELRTTMEFGDERTAKMLVIYKKMKAGAKDILPSVPSLVNNKSGGCRLAAVAALEEFPDPEYLDWLAERVGEGEHRFIGYHASVALRQFMESMKPEYKEDLMSAIQKAVGRLNSWSEKDPNQYKVITGIKKELDKTPRKKKKGPGPQRKKK
jgi:hypothetical protein